MTDDDTNKLAVEVASLRGEMRTAIEQLSGRIGSLEQEIKGHLNARRNEVDGKLAMLTSISSDLRESMGKWDGRQERVTADLDSLHDQFRDHVSRSAGARERTLSTREWVLFVLTFLSVATAVYATMGGG